MALDTGKNFGNYLLHGMTEFDAPAVISFSFSAPGWKILGLVIVLMVIWQGARWLRYRRITRYRRLALHQLDRACTAYGTAARETLALLPLLLKQVVLEVFPREAVAGLYGEAWVLFLNSKSTTTTFSKDQARALHRISYEHPDKDGLSGSAAADLVQTVRLWIISHEVSV